MPAGFQVAGAEGDADEATVVYVRVAALEQEVTASPNLLCVIADVEVCPDPAAAQATYTANDPTLDSIVPDVQENAGETALLDVQPYAVTVSVPDTVIAYRVEYLIGLVPVMEYRYRWQNGERGSRGDHHRPDGQGRRGTNRSPGTGPGHRRAAGSPHLSNGRWV